MTSASLNVPSNALYWQARLQATGDVAVDVDDIHQAINIILLTRKGEDPRRPEFGSGVWQHLDHPLTDVLPLIVRDALAAISRWETRIRVTHITVNPVVEDPSWQFGGHDRQCGARLVVSICWVWSGLEDGSTTESYL